MADKHESLKMEDFILNPVIFQNILYEARDIIMFFSIDGKTIYANKAAENIYGYSKEEFCSINIYDLAVEETLQENAAIINTLTNGGHLFCTVHKRRDGETFPVEISAKLHKFNQKYVVVCLIRDISQIVAVEKALKNSEYRYHIEHEDLLAAHEELAATEEDLRQQYNSLRVSEEKFSKVFNFSPDVMAITRLKDGMYIDVNPSFTKLAGCTKEEVIGKTSLELGFFTLKNRDRLIEQLQNNGEVRNLETVLKLKNGSTIHVSMSAGVFNIEDEQYLLTVTRDITENMQMKEQLMLSEQKYRTIFEAANDGIIIHDLTTGNILDVNEKACEFKGYSREEILSSRDNILGQADPDYDFNEALNRIKLASNGKPQLFEWKSRHKDGHFIWEEVNLQRTVIENKECVLSFVREISERKQMEEQLKYLSLHDSLTKLHNRAYFEDQLMQLQKSGKHTVGLLMCDVDGLKIINDTLGHNTGDIILQTVANILRDTFSSEDLVARIGGDEFVILMKNCSIDELAVSSKRIQNQIKEHNRNNPTLPISLSIGYAISSQTPLDITVLMRDADYNMYREKLHRQKSAHHSIVLALMKALEARDFLTGGHSERMQNMIQLFANTLGLPENRLADLKLFAHFHDIGKVGIPDSILFKQTSLSEEEWIIMRQHCEIGYRIAKATPDLLPIADWILDHQEHWNGSGYPNGLKGDAIPLECRMLAIMDAYDAMTSDRPYRKAMSKELAVEELKRCAGTQFDPSLIEPFLKILS